MTLALATLLVLVIIFMAPLAVYGLFTVIAGLKEPNASARFLVSVLVQKVGTAITFVVLFYLARDWGSGSRSVCKRAVRSSCRP